MFSKDKLRKEHIREEFIAVSFLVSFLMSISSSQLCYQIRTYFRFNQTMKTVQNVQTVPLVFSPAYFRHIIMITKKPCVIQLFCLVS